MWVLAVREDCSQSSSSSSYIKDTTGVVIEDGFFFFGLIHFSFLEISDLKLR